MDLKHTAQDWTLERAKDQLSSRKSKTNTDNNGVKWSIMSPTLPEGRHNTI